MSKLDIINSILHENFKDGSIWLSEKDKDKNGVPFEMKRKIIGKPHLEYSVYKYDTNKELFPFFKANGVDNLKKICDYILFIEEGVHFFVFLVELKKGSQSAKKQLDAGQCFVNYLLETIQRLNFEFEITPETSHYRKIRICESRSIKKTLKTGFVEDENGIINHKHPTSFYIEEYLTY